MLETKIISAMEKCFLEMKPDDFQEIKSIRMYKNEKASIQLIAYDGEEAFIANKFYKIKLKGPMGDYAKIYTVENIINYSPAYSTPAELEKNDNTFLKTTPGMYPDILLPLMHLGSIPVINQQMHTAIIEFSLDGKADAGESELAIELYDDKDELVSKNTITVTVIDALIPDRETIMTNWFHADCLADYYQLEVFSDEHFSVCEEYIKTAVEYGTNMILMPVFTLPLDTAIGGERTTTQLVKVTADNDGYKFDFTLAERWIDMCRRCGVEYLEISHLFTQWGAGHAPKIMADVNGEYKKIFGWETDSASDEYIEFLRNFISDFTEFLKDNWDFEKVYFHLSDEPGKEHIERYKLLKNKLADVLSGKKIIDAVSDVEFYQEGVCELPVPITSSIEDFMKETPKERWAYYCAIPWIKTSNRAISMSLSRTRSIGIQMYKYGISGFLHWGYNFYNNQYSHDHINPFINTCAGYWCLTGDAYLVYPAQNRKPIKSLRLQAMYQAMQDIRICALCESLYGKDAVVNAIEDVTGNLDFKTCVNDSSAMQKIRDRIDGMIIEKLQ